MDTVLSKTFSLLRFPLIVMVVFIHIYGSTIMVMGILLENVMLLFTILSGEFFHKIYLL